MPPNVLLVVFDTARADAVEPYGAPVGATPVLADLAAEGTWLPSIYATSNWTLPSHASMFSGLLPRTLGLASAASPADALNTHQDRLLPVVLSRRGFHTAAASANAWIVPHHGFALGFDEFIEVAAERPHRPEHGLRGRLRWARGSVKAQTDDGLGRIEEVVMRWISEARGGPAFWFVNLMECHSPYLPPRPYNDLPFLERLQAGEDARRFQSHDGFLGVSTGAADVPERSLERMRHLYARSVRMMDDWLGRILEELDRHAMLDDTLVIATSDHGENLGENHLLGHVLSLDDRLIRVPFVARGPGAPAATTGATSLAGLPALIAGALDLEDHPWSDPPCPGGLAIAQYDGVTVGAGSERELARAWNLDEADVARLQEPLTGVTDGRFKLVQDGAGTRLFDLATDPMEQNDVSEHHARLVQRLGVFATQAGSTGEVATWDTDARLEDRLRQLGYL